MGLVVQEPDYTYVSVNLGELFIPGEIQSRSFGLDGYLEPVLSQLKDAVLGA